jgi:hypothetical protein
VLVAYLSLDFDSSFKDRAHIAKQRKVLLSLEGGKAKVRMAEAKGSCSKIYNIYIKYLNPWFRRALKGDEASQNELRDLFEKMKGYDNDMMDAIDDLAIWIGDKTKETLDEVDKGLDEMDKGQRYFDAANRIIRNARNEIMPLRRKASDELSKLQTLKGEMIGISGAI